MGSLSSPSRLSRQSQDYSLSNYLVFVSFCGKGLAHDANMSSWIECYNPSNGSWHRVTSIPGLSENHVLKGFFMVSIGDSIYIIGGRRCHKIVDHDTNEMSEIDLEVRATVLRYNVRTDEWSECAPLGNPRFDFACTVSDNKIYVAGGQCTLGGARGISSAEVFDPALDEWKPLPNMSTSRYKCVGVTWQGRIHVMGGFSDRPYTIYRSSAEVYNTRHDRWDFLARMWELDVPPNQIVDVEGRLFSSGDCLNSWKGHIDAYDGKQNIWYIVDGSHSDSLSTSDASEADWPTMQRQYLTMAPIRSHLYFLAGYRMPGNISRMRSEVHVFDTSANGEGWKTLEPMEVEGEKELCCHCCVVKQVSQDQN